MLDGSGRGLERDFQGAVLRGVTPGIMELQRTSSISGPLSPAYTGQVPYNYNQLEGRFKQLQGKPPPKGRACPGAVPTGVLGGFICDPNEDGRLHSSAPDPVVGCGHPIHDLGKAVAHTPLQKSYHLESLSLQHPFGFLGCQITAAHTFS